MKRYARVLSAQRRYIARKNRFRRFAAKQRVQWRAGAQRWTTHSLESWTGRAGGFGPCAQRCGGRKNLK